MKIAGIVAEYNPFHNGHKFQLDETKKNATHIVAIMSGSFTQRGDIAVMSKWARAKQALDCGVDLVIELPTVFAVSAANIFAHSAVYLLNELGIDYLSFGSEIGDVALLRQTAKAVSEAENSKLLKSYLANGDAYPTAIKKTLAEKSDTLLSSILEKPNNLLAIEYLKAIDKINPNITPLAIMRIGVCHDSTLTNDNIASASKIRTLLQENNYEIARKYMPKIAYNTLIEEIVNVNAPCFDKNLEIAILYKLRTMTIDEFKALPDVIEGLENRIIKAVEQSNSLEQLYELIKTKRYTMARIRRIIFCALLGITKSVQRQSPQYLRILGANERGIEILKSINKTTKSKIITKLADAPLSSQQLQIDIKATNIFTLATQNKTCSKDFTTSPIMPNNN